MLLPGHLTEGGNTPAERTAITEIRKEIIMILATTTVEDVDRFLKVSDPEVPPILKEAGHLGKPDAAALRGQYQA